MTKFKSLICPIICYNLTINTNCQAQVQVQITRPKKPQSPTKTPKKKERGLVKMRTYDTLEFGVGSFWNSKNNRLIIR